MALIKVTDMAYGRLRAPDLAAQKQVAEAVQLREREVVTHIWLGQWYQPIAARKSVTGILTAPVPVFWNVEKKGS